MYIVYVLRAYLRHIRISDSLAAISIKLQASGRMTQNFYKLIQIPLFFKLIIINIGSAKRSPLHFVKSETAYFDFITLSLI